MGTPIFSAVNPVDEATNADANIGIVFTVADAGLMLDFNSIEVYVQAARVYTNAVAYRGFNVTSIPVVGGYTFTVQTPNPYPYSGTIEVSLYASDTLGNSATTSFSFDIEASPACFSGPVNTFEESLLVPYTTASLKYTEQMRQALLLNLIRTREPEPSVRALFLLGHEIELNSVLRGLVTPPTDLEKSVTLCQRISLIEVYDSLPRKSVWISHCIQELGSLGLPQEHREMIKSYAQLTEPVLIISLMCFLVMLAKTLETP